MNRFVGIELLDNAPNTRLLRGLKGGSGGGGGGGSGGGSRGSSSGGSRGYYGSNSSSGSGEDNLPTWAVILISVIMMLVCGWICYPKAKKNQSGSPGSDSSFNQDVTKAQQKQTEANNVYALGNSTPQFETYEGDFDVKYLDRGNVHSGFAKIQLKHTSPRYKIEGQVSDADGTATITEGFVTYAGDAFWVEETMSGEDKGLKVLTEGTFEFNNNTFSGTWRASNGVRGQYQSFTGKNISKTFGLGGNMASTPQTLEQQLAEDIPMVVATVETPVVAAAPSAPFVVQAVPESSTQAFVPSVVVQAAVANPEPSAPPEETSPSNQGNTPAEPYVPRRVTR